jgi:hypothetical protein
MSRIELGFRRGVVCFLVTVIQLSDLSDAQLPHAGMDSREINPQNLLLPLRRQDRTLREILGYLVLGVRCDSYIQ